MCDISYSLDYLAPPMSDEEQPNPPIPSNLIGGDIVNKRTSSLLSHVARADTNSLAKSSHEFGDSIADDCAISPHANCICYHPSHSFSYLLDSIHWSTLLLVDDAVRRWPLQVNTHAFRAILRTVDSGTASQTDQLGSSTLNSWWKHFLHTGEVPLIQFEPTDMRQQFYLQDALKQLRKHTIDDITRRFHMDEKHRNQQIPDWMSVGVTKLMANSSSISFLAMPSHLQFASLFFFLLVCWSSLTRMFHPLQPICLPDSLPSSSILFHCDRVRI